MNSQSTPSFAQTIDQAVFINPRRLELSAWTGHIPVASQLVALARPRILVELGTHLGNSYFAFCQAVAENRTATKCYAVDTWEGDEHSRQYGEEVFASVSAHNQKHYAGFSTLLRTTFDDALSYFEDGSVDLLHIDGLHTYEAVRHDFESWLPKLSDRAVVLFHDTNVREREFGVWKFWSEIKGSHPSFEFDHTHGLGVLAVGEHVPDNILEVIGSWKGKDEGALTRTFYAHLGERLQLKYELSAAQAYIQSQAAAHWASEDEAKRALSAARGQEALHAEQMKSQASLLDAANRQADVLSTILDRVTSLDRVDAHHEGIADMLGIHTRSLENVSTLLAESLNAWQRERNAKEDQLQAKIDIVLRDIERLGNAQEDVSTLSAESLNAWQRERNAKEDQLQAKIDIVLRDIERLGNAQEDVSTLSAESLNAWQRERNAKEDQLQAKIDIVLRDIERLGNAQEDVRTLSAESLNAWQRERNAKEAELHAKLEFVLSDIARLGSGQKAVLDDQRVLRSWAERRSFSYWWRRLRGGANR